MNQPASITLNGTTYAMTDLSEAARAQVDNVQLVDAEIARLQRQIAIAQTARHAYAAALAAAVEGAQGKVSATPTTPTTLN